MSYRDFFEGKKVTLMGLGLLGRGLGDAIFLAEQGAELIVTDLRDEAMLAPSLEKLKKYKNIKYVLGKHRLEDFSAKGGQAPPDFILKAAGVPLDSLYITEAVKNKIPIEMDASLFAKLMPKGVTLVGVTGTRGKSTTTALIYEILSSSAPFQRGSTESSRGRGSGSRIFKGGNLVPEATLPLLAKVKSGDIVVLELDSWQLQGFHDAKISPQVAVFTTFLDDHLVYYKGDTDRYFEDKVAIFTYQKANDVLIAGERVAELIGTPPHQLLHHRKSWCGGKSEIPVNGDFVVTKRDDVPKDWNIPIPGEHNLENIACALAVGKHFNIPDSAVKKAVENFKAVSGRLEFIREVRGVKIYNDNNATTPDATIAGLRALSPLIKGALPSSAGGLSQPPKAAPFAKGDIILIMGGTDKGLDMSKLVEEIPKHCKAVILLRETGTEKLIFNYQFPIFKKDTLKECVQKAVELAERNDIVLFSPAFASFGKWFKNEYDRGEQFVELIKKL